MVKATSRRQEYTPAGFADDLAWLCGQLRVEKPVVVGHSMGGNVAFVSTNMRTAASTAKQHTKTMTPTIRFFFALKQCMAECNRCLAHLKKYPKMRPPTGRAASAGGVREGSAAVRFPRGQVAEGDLGFVLFLSCALRQSFRSFSAPTSPASPPPIQK